MLTETTCITATTTINGYEVPNKYVKDAAETYFDMIHGEYIPDMCRGCDAKIHDRGDWNNPETWDCLETGNFSPYLTCCRRHSWIYDDVNILEMAYDCFAEDCIED